MTIRRRRTDRAPLVSRARPGALMACLALSALLLSACAGNHRDQPRYEAYEPSTFFDDFKSARQLPENTVARGVLREDTLLYTGKINPNAEAFSETFPFPVTMEVLERGRERYNINCAPCHGKVGDGDGMIVRRGYSRPPSFHTERLRNQPPGYIFDVITSGYGAMPAYNDQVTPRDRWAIVAYLRALQVSQNVPVDQLSPEERSRLDQPQPAPEDQGTQEEGQTLEGSGEHND